MHARLRTASLLVVSVLALAACGGNGGDGGSATGAQGEFPMTVQTCGRQATFDKRPERVVVVGTEAAALMVAAGAGDKISAAALNEGAPLDSATQAVVDRVEKIGFAHEITQELVIGARPDVVITERSVQPETLESAGIQTVFLRAYCEDNGLPPERAPSPFELIYGEIELYGKLFGTQATATRAVADYRVRVSAVEQRFKDAGERPAAALDTATEGGLFSYGSRSMVGEQMKILGFRNVFGDVDGRWIEVSAEQMIDRDPETLIALYVASNGTTAESTAAKVISAG